MDCSPPGSSFHRISQARILEWVAMPSSRKSSQPRNWTRLFCIAGRFFTAELVGKPIKRLQESNNYFCWLADLGQVNYSHFPQSGIWDSEDKNCLGGFLWQIYQYGMPLAVFGLEWGSVSVIKSEWQSWAWVEHGGALLGAGAVCVGYGFGSRTCVRQVESLSCQVGVVLWIVGAAGGYSQRDMVTVTF